MTEDDRIELTKEDLDDGAELGDVIELTHDDLEDDETFPPVKHSQPTPDASPPQSATVKEQ